MAREIGTLEFSRFSSDIRAKITYMSMFIWKLFDLTYFVY